MGRKPSAKCTYCEETEQDFVHLYIQCPGVNQFRNALSRDWQGEEMDPKRWFLGSSGTNDILEKSKNILAKEVNHYIFKMNWTDNTINVEAFKNWLRSDEEPEEALAQRVNKMFDHYQKWSYIQHLLQ